jgi:hypothetical protein
MQLKLGLLRRRKVPLRLHFSGKSLIEWTESLQLLLCDLEFESTLRHKQILQVDAFSKTMRQFTVLSVSSLLQASNQKRSFPQQIIQLSICIKLRSLRSFMLFYHRRYGQ